MKNLAGGQGTALATIVLAIATVVVGFVLPFETAMGVTAAILAVIIVLSLSSVSALTKVLVLNSTLQALSIGGFVLTVLGITTALGWMASTDEAAVYYLQALAVYTVILHVIIIVAFRKATTPVVPPPVTEWE